MHRGFTLLELLITVAVLTALLLFAAPNFSKVNQQAKVVNLANELQGFLIQAKSESVLRNQDLWVHIQGLSPANATGNWQLKLTASSAANTDPISLFLGDRYRNIYVEAKVAYDKDEIKFDHVMGNPQISGLHISEHSDQSFRDYPITHFGLNRSLIPRLSDHF
ncbi:Type IV fimbrial biogenesis protein FimT [Vibrio cholerae]|nr:Type IV fimbrial biogenesis protein FimT [Vibrio cholerae]